MNKIAILYNGSSSQKSARVELIAQLHDRGMQPYYGGIFDGEINEFFNEQTAIYCPIIASRNNTNPFVELKSLASVKKVVKENGIDSAIVYGVKNHAAMAIGARLGGAKKVLCIVNGSGNLFRIGGVKGFILRAISFPMLKIAYKLSAAVCFQNSDDKQLFIKKHLVKDSDKCFVTGGSGTNLSIFTESELPKEDRFMFLARITASKGIKEYINAAMIVKNKYPNAIFDVIGPIDTAVEEGIGSQLEDAARQNIVNYHGPTDDVPSKLKECRFFVYPSYYPEGVPRCAIQAIATGRPIITCDTPGCKETAVDGSNGFIIPPRDEQALAEKMIWMIENPDKVSEMAKQSRRLAEEKFDVIKINEQLIESLK